MRTMDKFPSNSEKVANMNESPCQIGLFFRRGDNLILLSQRRFMIMKLNRII